MPCTAHKKSGYHTTVITRNKLCHERLLLYREFIDAAAGVFLTRLEVRRRPVGLVGRVRVFLGLQADRGALRVDGTVLAGQGTIQEIPRVYLYPGLVGVYLEPDAGSRRVNRCCYS